MSSLPLIFAHIGDLHITRAQEQNYIDLLSIISQIETELGDQLDFVVLPGDNADNGKPEQYRLVATALKMLSVPVYILSGDHDMEQGSLDNLYAMPFARQMPFSKLHKGNRCIFIDVCGPGSGGPDFRIGEQQLQWLHSELAQETNAGETILLFMHTFPADLKDAAEKQLLNELLARYNVTLVDMGHTHYNEITNNGQTIFTATRSTGQIEEGPVGYTVISTYNGVVSWRFKHLADPFPLVMINSPVDYRLANNSAQKVGDELEVCATILGSRPLKSVECRTDIANWVTMTEFNKRFWKTTLQTPENLTGLTVKATDVTGRPGQWTIQPLTEIYTFPIRIKDGSDADTIGAWPENGIFGTQLGPNSNGKPS
ncbi:metallophosphoesterase [Mucilaginibacter sp. RS28]|uniref:Metallophosphoesterase n=1 Tax=Mucilaginibacter straminoryzae TaxID=2932774 RepID=A0A9X2B7W8_9SPHI|nr:metallophosphoesterase [Mucilaginibacter straminoryzae]MCJ8209039.1 metallophosphoesterase [Mucilaginibacter straminoryzae]